jgi:hypothetical protein
MNRALWRKAFFDVWVQLLISSLVLVGFSWIFLWLISLFKADVAFALIKALPEFIPRILGLPIAELVTPTGAISLVFVHVVTLLVCIGWIGRNLRRDWPRHHGSASLAAGMAIHFNYGSRRSGDIGSGSIGSIDNAWNSPRVEDRAFSR